MTGYAPQGYYDPIETDAGIVDFDDPRPKGDTMTTFAEDLLEAFGGGDEAEDTMRDLANNSADAGWPGIIYYRDTVAMYEKHEDEIWQALDDDAEEMGLDHPMALIATFGGAKDVRSADQFANLLCWYMAERVAREYDR